MSFDYKSIKYDLDVTHKSFFNSIADVGEKLINVDNVIEKIKEYQKTITYTNENLKRNDYNFTHSDRNKETSIERFISAYDKNYSHQYPFEGKEQIDLIRKNAENIEEIIELKHEDGGDSPLYALIEIVKNYYLLKSKYNHNVKELTILAPKEYFDTYFKKNYVKDKEKLKKEFFKIVKNFENKLKEEFNSDIKINLKTLNFTSKDIFEFRDKNQDKSIKELAKEFFDKRGGLNDNIKIYN